MYSYMDHDDNIYSEFHIAPHCCVQMAWLDWVAELFAIIAVDKTVLISRKKSKWSTKAPRYGSAKKLKRISHTIEERRTKSKSLIINCFINNMKRLENNAISVTINTVRPTATLIPAHLLFIIIVFFFICSYLLLCAWCAHSFPPNWFELDWLCNEFMRLSSIRIE